MLAFGWRRSCWWGGLLANAPTAAGSMPASALALPGTQALCAPGHGPLPTDISQRLPPAGGTLPGGGCHRRPPPPGPFPKPVGSGLAGAALGSTQELTRLALAGLAWASHATPGALASPGAGPHPGGAPVRLLEPDLSSVKMPPLGPVQFVFCIHVCN